MFLPVETGFFGEYMLKIGNNEYENNIFLAPMAGVTDRAFRIICKENGAGFVYTEMVSAKGISYKSEKSAAIADVSEDECPAGVQIFGRDPLIMAGIAYQLNDSRAEIMDINMGCPAPKITKNGEGSALLKEPVLVGNIIREVVKASVKPVTVKIRKGWDDDTVNAAEIAKIAEDSGAKGITVHGRTRAQFYSGKADWGIIKKVKECVDIPVIGNGDIFSPKDAKNMIEYTKCDGVMIARGAEGNPWIFDRTYDLLKRINIAKNSVEGYTGDPLEEKGPPALQEKINVMKKHFGLLLEHKGEVTAVREMRRHIASYVKGIRNCSVIKVKAYAANTAEGIINVIENIGLR